jgi:predicted RNA-binding protein
MADKRFSKLFVRELKRDANNLIKSSDRFINYVSANSEGELNEEIFSVYEVISRLVEDRIEWEQEETQTT